MYWRKSKSKNTQCLLSKKTKDEAYRHLWERLRKGGFLRVSKAGREIWIKGSYKVVVKI